MHTVFGTCKYILWRSTHCLHQRAESTVLGYLVEKIGWDARYLHFVLFCNLEALLLWLLTVSRMGLLSVACVPWLCLWLFCLALMPNHTKDKEDLFLRFSFDCHLWMEECFSSSKLHFCRIHTNGSYFVVFISRVLICMQYLTILNRGIALFIITLTNKALYVFSVFFVLLVIYRLPCCFWYSLLFNYLYLNCILAFGFSVFCSVKVQIQWICWYP